MLYEPNAIQWGKGNIVIHWCDAKEPKMLMKVIGHTRAGLIKTQYIDKSHKRTVYENDAKNLLNPRDFGLMAQELAQDYLEMYQRNWLMVRRWNRAHPSIGVRVIVHDTRGAHETITTTDARMQGMAAWVYLEYGGAWDLEAVSLASEIERAV